MGLWRTVVAWVKVVTVLAAVAIAVLPVGRFEGVGE